MPSAIPVNSMLPFSVVIPEKFVIEIALLSDGISIALLGLGSRKSRASPPNPFILIVPSPEVLTILFPEITMPSCGPSNCSLINPLPDIAILPPLASIITACCCEAPISIPCRKSLLEAIAGLFKGSLPPPMTISPPLVLMLLPGLISIAPPF